MTSANPDPRQLLTTLTEENPDATEQELFELLVDAVKDEPEVRDTRSSESMSGASRRTDRHQMGGDDMDAVRQLITRLPASSGKSANCGKQERPMIEALAPSCGR